MAFDKEKLRELMKRDGYSARSLGDACGLDHSHIWHMLSGYRRLVRFATVETLADIFSVTTDEFREKEEP